MGIVWCNLSEVTGLSGVCIVLVDEKVHIVITSFICLFKFIIEKLGVINAEASVLAAHAHYLVDHVQLVLWNLRSCILLANHLAEGLVLCFLDIEKRFGRCTAHLL